MSDFGTNFPGVSLVAIECTTPKPDAFPKQHQDSTVQKEGVDSCRKNSDTPFRQKLYVELVDRYPSLEKHLPSSLQAKFRLSPQGAAEPQLEPIPENPKRNVISGDLPLPDPLVLDERMIAVYLIQNPANYHLPLDFWNAMQEQRIRNREVAYSIGSKEHYVSDILPSIGIQIEAYKNQFKQVDFSQKSTFMRPDENDPFANAPEVDEEESGATFVSLRQRGISVGPDKNDPFATAPEVVREPVPGPQLPPKTPLDSDEPATCVLRPARPSKIS